jgi:hypothetical protein
MNYASKRRLQYTAKGMDNILSKIEEVSTRLTEHLEKYNRSGSSTHAPRSVQVGPRDTHPSRRPQIEEEREYKKSEINTQVDTQY